jgi:galactokinase/mevalonate kinase-like predicted kinase
MEHEFCSRHKLIEEKLNEERNNWKFWTRLLNSKWSHFIIGGLITLLIAFGGWTVREIYAQKANEKENKKTSEMICTTIKDVKESISDIKEDAKEIKRENQRREDKRDEQREKDQKEIKRDNEKRDELIRANQMRIIELLSEIKKQMKKRGE